MGVKEIDEEIDRQERILEVLSRERNSICQRYNQTLQIRHELYKALQQAREAGE